MTEKQRDKICVEMNEGLRAAGLPVDAVHYCEALEEELYNTRQTLQAVQGKLSRRIAAAQHAEVVRVASE